MLVASLINATITRYDFGTNIKNNAPTGKLLGNPGNLLALPRSLCILSDCDQLITLVLNEDKKLIKLNFGKSITDTPITTSATTTGISQQNGLNTFFVDSIMYANIVSFGSNSLCYGKLITFPGNDTTKYYNDTFSHKFSTAGTQSMTLYINQGSHMGSEAFCKSVEISPLKILRDTGACEGQSLVLDASAANTASYLWSTKAIAILQVDPCFNQEL